MEHNLKEYNRQVIEEFREKRSKGQYPFFADHQAKITRQIPVIVLERREG
ncbi:MAG TPA: hypothetical protein VK134_05325 [Ktedonobacteraceae bacterium]|nr:hypothetical protein [Ktedonobacteraceae bacterium]